MRDALLARVARLGPGARDVLELVSASPTALELDVIQAICSPDSSAQVEAVASGLLVSHDGGLRFGHELARLAVVSTLGPRAAPLHAALFDALGWRPASLERRVHHAEHAGLALAVLQLAPLAAEAATQASAHRQAAALHHRVLGRMEWMRGRAAAGVVHAESARMLLEQHDPNGRELAMALGTLAQLHPLAQDATPALRWAAQALAIFERCGDEEGRAYVLNTLGASHIGGAQHVLGVQRLQQALAPAVQHGLEELAGRAWTNLASVALVESHYTQLDELVRDGLAYCAEHDLEVFAVHLQVRRACGQVARGQWVHADAAFEQLAQRDDLNPMQREQVAHLRAVQAARRGLPGSAAYWDELERGARVLSVLPWLVSVDVHRVEVGWLNGGHEQAAVHARQALEVGFARVGHWRCAQLAIWLQRLGHAADVLPGAPLPFEREAAGDWRGAACANAARVLSRAVSTAVFEATRSA